MSKSNNLTDFLTDIADTIRRKKGTTAPINPQDFSSEIESINGGGGQEWQPSADMQWGKSVCENDVNTDDPNLNQYKIFQYMSNEALSDNIVVPSKCAVKTSDGVYYSTSGTKQHIWKNIGEHDSIDYPGVKLRWIITYYNVKEPSSLQYLDEVMYVCFNNISIRSLYFYRKVFLQYFDLINTASLSDNCKSLDTAFNECVALQMIPVFDTSKVTSASSMFSGCINIKTIPLIDTSNVTSMYQMFNNCYSLEKIPLLDTHNVTSMYNMFTNCKSLQTIPLLDTSNVTEMRNMFNYCQALKSIPLIDTHNVTKMDSMFGNCYNLLSVPLLDTSSVTSTASMLYYCSSLKYVPEFNTSSLTNATMMFYGCRSLLSATFSTGGNQINLSSLFSSCDNLLSVHIEGLDTATSISSIMSSCTKLQNLQLTAINKTIDISSSTKYPKEILIDIIDNLMDLTGLTAQTLKMGTTNKNKLSAEDIAIATAKNWTIT